MDKIEFMLNDTSVALKLTLDLLCQFETTFGAVTDVLKKLENGQLPYNQMIKMADLILQDQWDGDLQAYVMAHGVKEIQEMLFHFCARYSLGQEYLKQVAGEPIMGEP